MCLSLIRIHLIPVEPFIEQQLMTNETFCEFFLAFNPWHNMLPAASHVVVFKIKVEKVEEKSSNADDFIFDLIILINWTELRDFISMSNIHAHTSIGRLTENHPSSI